MLRYLVTLAAALFVTWQIAGRDTGQQRFGLAGAYDPRPHVQVAPAQVSAASADPVVLAAFSPEPASAAPAPAPVPEPVAAAEPVAAEPAPAPAAQSRVLWVKSNSINLREGPSTETAVLGRLSRNEAVTVVGEAPDGWLRVRLEGDGGEGYVAARLLTDTEPGT
jgi:uncharacterized protein YgiM (DUF1202 family)